MAPKKRKDPLPNANVQKADMNANAAFMPSMVAHSAVPMLSLADPAQIFLFRNSSLIQPAAVPSLLQCNPASCS